MKTNQVHHRVHLGGVQGGRQAPPACPAPASRPPPSPLLSRPSTPPESLPAGSVSAHSQCTLFSLRRGTQIPDAAHPARPRRPTTAVPPDMSRDNSSVQPLLLQTSGWEGMLSGLQGSCRGLRGGPKPLVRPGWVGHALAPSSRWPSTLVPFTPGPASREQPQDRPPVPTASSSRWGTNPVPRKFFLSASVSPSPLPPTALSSERPQAVCAPDATQHAAC